MKFIAIIFFLAFLSASAHAQSNFSSPDFIFYVQHNPDVTTSFTCKNPAVLGAVLHAGDTNAMWDFSIANYTMDPPHVEADSFMLPNGLPLANDSDFANSDVVIRTTLSPTSMRYHFFSIHGSGSQYDLGITEVNNGVARKVIGWNPPIQDAVFPMTYETAWQSTAIENGDTLQQGENRVIVSKSNVDGWGNLGLPTPYPKVTGALRVKEQRIERTILNGVTTRLDTTIIYHYYTEGFYSATITTDPQGMIIGADYTGNVLGTADITATPAGHSDALNLTITQNPASHSTTTILYSLRNDANARVELMDMLGRSVRVLQEGRAGQGQHILEIDPTTLASGSYFIRAEAEGRTAMQKLVIAR